MASNGAIVIGINQYRFLPPLKYAKRDAESMKGFLTEEAKFDHTFLFTDDSPEIGGKSTEPCRADLLRFLRQIFASPFMEDGDNFWFFFSGHGIPHNGQDYLMPGMAIQKILKTQPFPPTPSPITCGVVEPITPS